MYLKYPNYSYNEVFAWLRRNCRGCWRIQRAVEPLFKNRRKRIFFSLYIGRKTFGVESSVVTSRPPRRSMVVEGIWRDGVRYYGETTLRIPKRQRMFARPPGRTYPCRAPLIYGTMFVMFDDIGDYVYAKLSCLTE